MRAAHVDPDAQYWPKHRNADSPEVTYSDHEPVGVILGPRGDVARVVMPPPKLIGFRGRQQ